MTSTKPKTGLASDFNGERQAGPAQDSKLAKLNYQELLETRVLNVAGVRQPIDHASLFDRDDNMRIATTENSFELPTEELVDLQDRFTSASAPAASTISGPIKVQGKEYTVKSIGEDVLVAEGSEGTVVAALTASTLLVILTKTDQIEAVKTLAFGFSEGLSQQAV